MLLNVLYNNIFYLINCKHFNNVLFTNVRIVLQCKRNILNQHYLIIVHMHNLYTLTYNIMHFNVYFELFLNA